MQSNYPFHNGRMLPTPASLPLSPQFSSPASDHKHSPYVASAPRPEPIAYEAAARLAELPQRARRSQPSFQHAFSLRCLLKCAKWFIVVKSQGKRHVKLVRPRPNALELLAHRRFEFEQAALHD